MSAASRLSWAGSCAIGAVALLAMVLLYRGTVSVDAGEQARYRGAIVAVSRGEAAIDQDVLRLHQGYLHHYDTLDSGIADCGAGLARLAVVPASCDATSREVLGAALARCRARLEDKRAALDAFKADRAILVNSLRYLPLEVAALSSAAGSGSVEREVAERLRGLLQAILLYNLHGGGAEVAGISADLDAIRGLAAARAGGAGNASLALDHAARILAVKPQVDADMARILDAATDQALDGFSADFDEAERIALERGSLYRAALVGLCLLLAGGLAFFLNRLRLALASLGAARDTLEQRVAERTDALSAANRELVVQDRERQHAIAGLVAAQARIQRIVTIMPTALIGTDGERRIVLWNAAAAAQTGIGLAAALGRPLAECGLAWDFAALHQELRGRDQAPVVLPEVRCALADGREGTLAVSACLLPEEGGEAGLLLAATDLTPVRAMQAQLHQAQKMESVGRLAAGVAHEINTPVQFVGDNLRFLQTACADLVPVLAAGQALTAMARGGDGASAALPAATAALADALGAADADYLVAEMPKAIAQALEGVERVATIVKSLKEFSHPDSDAFAPTDLRRTIESTLNVARNEYKYVADLVTDFAPDLPPVTCLAGELNQAVLNLVVNAAHAIGDRVAGGGGRGTITVSTRLDGAHAEVSVRDTGTGIPAAAQARLFEPFFTTKEVGKGTGQGLFLVHAVIVGKHHGTVAFSTVEGQGTAFVLRLPIAGPHAESAAPPGGAAA